jgi:hypothetical protein
VAESDREQHLASYSSDDHLCLLHTHKMLRFPALIKNKKESV